MVLYALLAACVNLVRTILAAILYPFTQAVITNQSTRLRMQDPRAAAAQFKREFEEKYGTLHPDFFEGGYSQALDLAKREMRFLMVLLQSDEHDNTEKFNNETLTSQRLISFLREKDILVWAGNLKDAEAYQVNAKLEATTYPFVGIIVLQPTSGSTGMGGKMVLADRIQGLTTPDELIGRITHQMNKYNSGLQRIRAERAERDAARQIREQQDSAYLASLRADQEKERRARENAEAQRLKEELAKKQKLERLALAEKKDKWQRWALLQLPDEPRQNEKDVTRLGFKLPDGRRVNRNFLVNESIETVYTFVDTLHLSKESISSGAVMQPDDYTHQFDFVLVSPYPRTIHSPEKSRTIKMEGLTPSAQLLVEGIAEESEEE